MTFLIVMIKENGFGHEGIVVFCEDDLSIQLD